MIFERFPKLLMLCLLLKV